MAGVTDAGQTRGSELKNVLGNPAVWLLIVVFSLVAGAAAGLYFNAGAGAAAFVAVFILGLVCAWAYANAMAKQAFYDAYADSHSLARNNQPFNELTPLLGKGDSRRTDLRLMGRLNGEFDGSIGLFTWKPANNAVENAAERENPFTVVMIGLPGTVPFVPRLIMEKKSGPEATEGLHDAVRPDAQRVELESAALDARYEIFTAKEQDPVWIRRFFSPSFIVWLSEQAPNDFAFELVNGNLVAYVPGHRGDTKGLEEMTGAGCTVARRLSEEIVE